MKNKSIFAIVLVSFLGLSFVLAYNGIQKKKESPETVVEKFTTAMAAGKCEEALKISTGDAKKTVNGAKNAGCESYETILKSVECEVQKDSAYCSCIEERGTLGDMKFDYDLVKIKRDWKVCRYQKDMEFSDPVEDD